MSRPRPVVLLKFACSLDGYLDHDGPEPYRFSSLADREAVLKIRSKADGILVGAGTVRRDNPSLLVREGRAQPARIVLFGEQALDPDSKLFHAGQGSVLICHPSCKAPSKDSFGSHVSFLSYDHRLGLGDLLETLYDFGISRLLVEGGAKVAASLLELRLVDLVRVSLAPVLLGCNGRAPLGVELRDCVHLETLKVQSLAESTVSWLAVKTESSESVRREVALAWYQQLVVLE